MLPGVSEDSQKSKETIKEVESAEPADGIGWGALAERRIGRLTVASSVVDAGEEGDTDLSHGDGSRGVVLRSCS